MIPNFRAWNKENKKMIDVDILNWNNGEVDFIGDGITFILKANDIVLMQSTGLTDKNGKEIFEGDIVKVTDGDERTNFPDGGIGTICGLDEIFMWYIDGQVHNGLFDISQEYYIEVIGNIYENPELLEVNQCLVITPTLD
nr:MAG: YopX protein [Bacteriophage sp.]